MRAVNLVPAESRAGLISGGRSGGAVYGVLGGLGVVLLAASSLALTHRDTARAQQELAGVQQSTQAYQAVAAQYASFGSAAQQVNQRIEVVRAISDVRFDWAGSMREIARIVPANVQILTLSAAVSGSAGSGGSSLSSTSQTPTITLSGCATSHVAVANFVTQLQSMRRVTNVSLQSTELSDDSGTGTQGGAGACSFRGEFANFAATVFLAPGTAQASAAFTGGAATAVSATTPTGSTPATTPAGN